MFSTSTRIHCLLPQLLFTAFLLMVCSSSYGEPAVAVQRSVADQVLAITVTGTDVPESKNFTFTCSYHSPITTLRDAVIAAPVPSTALSVIIDEPDSSVTVRLQANSTVKIQNDQQIILLRIPVAVGECLLSFTITSVTITDKNGTAIEATVTHSPPSGSTVSPAFAHYSSLRENRNAAITVLQLNGRRIGHDCSNRTVPGIFIRHTPSFTPVRTVIIRQP